MPGLENKISADMPKAVQNIARVQNFSEQRWKKLEILEIYLCYFFLAGANFWAILGNFWAILAILGHFWAIMGNFG